MLTVRLPTASLSPQASPFLAQLNTGQQMPVRLFGLVWFGLVWFGLWFLVCGFLFVFWFLFFVFVFVFHELQIFMSNSLRSFPHLDLATWLVWGRR